MIYSPKLLFVSALLVFQVYAAVATTKLNEPSPYEENQDITITPKEYEALMNTVQRGMLAQILLQKLQRAEDDEDTSVERIADEALIKNNKRFNRFQTGSTRTRAKLLQELREKLHGERRG